MRGQRSSLISKTRGIPVWFAWEIFSKKISSHKQEEFWKVYWPSEFHRSKFKQSGRWGMFYKWHGNVIPGNERHYSSPSWVKFWTEYKWTQKIPGWDWEIFGVYNLRPMVPNRWPTLKSPLSKNFGVGLNFAGLGPYRWKSDRHDFTSLCHQKQEHRENEQDFGGPVAQLFPTDTPSVDRRVNGTNRVDVLADLRRRRASTLVVNCSDWARYGGVVPWRQRCTGTHSRYWILSGTFSQWSSRGLESWAIISSLRILAKRRHSTQTVAVASEIQTHQSMPNDICRASWRLVHGSASATRLASLNTSHYISATVLRNTAWQLQ